MKVTNIQTERLCDGIDHAYAEHHVEKIKLNSAAFHSYPLTTLHFPKFNDTVYNSVACKKPCGVHLYGSQHVSCQPSVQCRGATVTLTPHEAGTVHLPDGDASPHLFACIHPSSSSSSDSNTAHTDRPSSSQPTPTCTNTQQSEEDSQHHCIFSISLKFIS